MMLIQKKSTLNEIMLAPKPTVWVYAHGELSRIISLTCQNNRTDDRKYPINPINHVNAVANIIIAYCDRTEIFPHMMGPISFAPFNMLRFSAVIKKRQDSVVATCGTDRPTRTLAGM